jgi:hypothetical protein
VAAGLFDVDSVRKSATERPRAMAAFFERSMRCMATRACFREVKHPRRAARVAPLQTVERYEIEPWRYVCSVEAHAPMRVPVPRHHPRAAATIRQRPKARPIVSKRLLTARTMAKFAQHG